MKVTRDPQLRVTFASHHLAAQLSSDYISWVILFTCLVPDALTQWSESPF